MFRKIIRYLSLSVIFLLLAGQGTLVEKDPDLDSNTLEYSTVYFTAPNASIKERALASDSDLSYSAIRLLGW